MNIAIGVILKEGKVLIGQRRANQKYPLLWEFPGGKVENGEHLTQALKRELREELGIEAGQIDPLHHCPFPDDPENVTLYFFVVQSFTGTPALKEHKGLVWVTLEEAKLYPLINVAMLKTIEMVQDMEA